jgi:hypothetical protein
MEVVDAMMRDPNIQVHFLLSHLVHPRHDRVPHVSSLYRITPAESSVSQSGTTEPVI